MRRKSSVSSSTKFFLYHIYCQCLLGLSTPNRHRHKVQAFIWMRIVHFGGRQDRKNSSSYRKKQTLTEWEWFWIDYKNWNGVRCVQVCHVLSIAIHEIWEEEKKNGFFFCWCIWNSSKPEMMGEWHFDGKTKIKSQWCLNEYDNIVRLGFGFSSF